MNTGRCQKKLLLSTKLSWRQAIVPTYTMRKGANKKPKAKAKLNPGQLYYIRHHMASVSVKQMSLDLELPESAVKAQVKAFEIEDKRKEPETAEAKETPRRPSQRVAKFDTYKGTIAMTPEQSLDDD